MKFYGKASETANRILHSFEDGEVPTALAQVFIHRKDSIPCRSWSWNNQIAAVLAGTNDARGFRQWNTAGRKVKKGSKAVYILAPCSKKIEDEDTGDAKTIVYGFRGCPVFRIEDTEIFDEEKWSAAGGVDQEAESWLDGLPLRDVAVSWGLSVSSYDGSNTRYLGYYRHDQGIAVGVKNLSTWAHELVHAADDRLGSLRKVGGQDASNEIVAELGGATLLTILGYDIDADLGGCLEYIQKHSGNRDKAINRSLKLLRRTCNAVASILDTADELNSCAVAS